MTTLTARPSVVDPSVAALPARRPSPTAQRSGARLTLFTRQARAELLKLLRAPDFVAPVVLLPVVLFALFGNPAIRVVTASGIALGPLLAASFTAYGVLGLVFFTFGEATASERGQGWLRLVRATPLPGWAFIGGKLAAGLALLVVLLLIMAPAATFLGVDLEPATWVRLGAVLALGGMALAPIGFAVGFLVRPSAAGAVSLLAYLPLSYASGMWTPFSELPGVVQHVGRFLPTYHLNQLGHAAVGVPVPDGAIHAAFLVGTFVVGGAIATVGYRRLAGRQFA